MSSKYSLERFVGHFSLFRNVFWVVLIIILIDYDTTSFREDFTKYFFAGYQFYVLFAIYACICFDEGLKHVSKKQSVFFFKLKFKFNVIKQKVSSELICFMVDALISILFNVISIIYYIVVLCIKSEEYRNAFKYIIPTLNTFFLLVNIFSLKLVKNAYDSISAKENERRMDKFSNPTPCHVKVENTYSGGYEETKAAPEYTEVTNKNIFPEESPDYQEVGYSSVKATVENFGGDNIYEHYEPIALKRENAYQKAAHL
jgi:hypothetical protein